LLVLKIIYSLLNIKLLLVKGVVTFGNKSNTLDL